MKRLGVSSTLIGPLTVIDGPPCIDSYTFSPTDLIKRDKFRISSMRKWSPSDSFIYACMLDPTNAVLAFIPLLGENESLEEDGDCAMHALVTPCRHTLQKAEWSILNKGMVSARGSEGMWIVPVRSAPMRPFCSLETFHSGLWGDFNLGKRSRDVSAP